jgi:hypothetical protein
MSYVKRAAPCFEATYNTGRAARQKREYILLLLPFGQIELQWKMAKHWVAWKHQHNLWDPFLLEGYLN